MTNDIIEYEATIEVIGQIITSAYDPNEVTRLIEPYKERGLMKIVNELLAEAMNHVDFGDYTHVQRCLAAAQTINAKLIERAANDLTYEMEKLDE